MHEVICITLPSHPLAGWTGDLDRVVEWSVGLGQGLLCTLAFLLCMRTSCHHFIQTPNSSDTLCKVMIHFNMLPKMICKRKC